MKVAIIGATGFVGRRVVDEALARGLQVTAIARQPKESAGRRQPDRSAG